MVQTAQDQEPSQLLAGQVPTDAQEKEELGMRAGPLDLGANPPDSSNDSFHSLQ